MQTYYERYLPHITPPGGIFFVTSSLKDSIPIQKIQVLKEQKAQLIQQYQSALEQGRITNNAYYEQLITQHKLHFKRYDELLDAAKGGQHHLKNTNASHILAEKFKQYDGQYYHLLAYTIMSNHFHLLIDTSIQLNNLPKGTLPNNKNYTPLSKIMQFIKGGSAYQINKLLNKKGTFWQHESYDHLVRDEQEQSRIIQYILNNPVKAKIVEKWQDYPFSFVKTE